MIEINDVEKIRHHLKSKISGCSSLLESLKNNLESIEVIEKTIDKIIERNDDLMKYIDEEIN